MPGLFFIKKIFIYQILFLIIENSPLPINKDEKQSTPNFNSQISQESNSNQGKMTERRPSQPSSSSYTASQTQDEVRYEEEIKVINEIFIYLILD